MEKDPIIPGSLGLPVLCPEGAFSNLLAACPGGALLPFLRGVCFCRTYLAYQVLHFASNFMGLGSYICGMHVRRKTRSDGCVSMGADAYQNIQAHSRHPGMNKYTNWGYWWLDLYSCTLQCMESRRWLF